MPLRTAVSLLVGLLAGTPVLAQGAGPYNPNSPGYSWSSSGTSGAAGSLQQTAFQPPPGPNLRPKDETQDIYKPQVEPPGPERLFRLDTEAQVKERIRQENRRPGGIERMIFPEEPVVSSEPYNPEERRQKFRPSTEVAEPNYVCYGRTYFDQLNAERYGWELGVLQPAISLASFYYDVILLPYHMATDPCRHYECNSGYCLPGDPVPYLIYPPDINLTGLAAEAGVVTGLTFAFR
jgi:hypothetical protein